LEQLVRGRIVERDLEGGPSAHAATRSLSEDVFDAVEDALVVADGRRLEIFLGE
jgi:hypothetical protein